MTRYLMLLAPSANRVYQAAAPELAASELRLTDPGAADVQATELAGIEYVRFTSDQLDTAELAILARQSSVHGLFEVVDDLLKPIELPNPYCFSDDLVTIPKYHGKTNEVFTRLLYHLTVAQVSGPGKQLDVLDPMAGRGTTLLTAWMSGANAFGVESDQKSFDALASYLKTYLRRGRYKHQAAVSPVRREGRSIGHRFDAQARLGETSPGAPTLELSVFHGDTRDAAKLFGKKRFDAIVTDAPYGVVHGAARRVDPVTHTGGRDRSPAQLLQEAIPVWATQLKAGGALGISWNTYSLTREQLVDSCTAAGLEVLDSDLWRSFVHRVDSAINRDLLVGVRR